MSGAARPAWRHAVAVLCMLIAVALTAPPMGAAQSPPGSPPAQSPGASPSEVAFSPPVGATASTDDVSVALASRLRTPEFSAATMEAMVEALARSGIGTYRDPGATTPVAPVALPVSPLRLLTDQVHALALDVWAGAGERGEDLDRVLPTPAKLRGRVPSTSGVIAAYVAAVDTPGAALARALIGPQDLRLPRDVSFPAVVLLLFASDLAIDGASPVTTPRPSAAPVGSPSGIVRGEAALGTLPGVRSDSVTAAASGICSGASQFINDTIANLFAALKVATPSNLPGRILVSLWNWVVDQGSAFVRQLISTVNDVVLGTIRGIAMTVSTVAESIASLVPYTVRVTVEQGSGTGATFFLQHDRALSGVFVATVTTGDLPDWPDILKDCAKAAKVTLPDFHPRAAPVAWGPVRGPADPFIYAQSATTVTDDQGQARWAFATALDPGTPEGAQRNLIDYMPVRVSRPELDRARQRLQEELFGRVPELVRPFVAALFRPFIGGLQSRIARLLDAESVGVAVIVYHEPPRPTPAPAGSAQPSATPRTTSAGLPDPCSLLHDYEVFAALGHDVAPVHGSATIGGFQSVACIFQDVPPDPRATTAHVRLDVFDLGKGAAATFRGFQRGSGLASGLLHGLGDAGFYATDPDGGGILYVRSGRYALALSVIGTPGGLTVGKRLMRLVLGRM